MRCPVSTSADAGGLRGVTVQDALEGPVSTGVIGKAVWPTAPDDVDPGASQDASGAPAVVVAGSSVHANAGRKGPR